MTAEHEPWGGDLGGLDRDQFRALVTAGFAQNRAKERLVKDEYENPTERHVDILMVGLPSLLQAADAVLDLALTQHAEDLLTIEEGPDDVGRRHPELTNIPADAFWSKGATLNRQGDAG